MVEVKLSRIVDAPTPVVWALVADSNRVDRALGLKPARYEKRQLDPDDVGSVSRVASASEMGFTIEWVEPPYRWIESRSMRGERKYLRGPALHSSSEFTLTPRGDKTELSARITTTGRGFAFAAFSPVLRAKLRAGLERYIDAIEDVLRDRNVAGEASSANQGEPPAAVAARALNLREPDAVVSGRATPIRETDLAHRAERFHTAPVDVTVRNRLVAHLRDRSDDDVTQMRPFELARAWGLERREVLRGFLHAARAGLVDLMWQVNCPNCRVAAGIADSLATVRDKAHCDTCAIGFDADFAAHVEAVFKINATIRNVEPALYCASSPWFRPHVFAQVTLEPGASDTRPAPLPTGPLLFRVIRGPQRATFEVGDARPATMRVVVNGETMTIEASDALVVDDADSEFTVENASDRTVTVLVERSGWNAEVVLGSVIATLPDFLDLFSSDAPAAGIELTVGAMTLLFTDLTGSTAMYERLGDARAFAVVQEHFRAMTEVVAHHGGAIVKTMGDAVMATFSSPADAFRAGVEMIERSEKDHGSLGLSVKVGLHEGPCLAVRANERLDFFGTTVNIAARLQAQANGGQIVVMESLLAHGDIAALLRERPLPRVNFQARLKGIREEQTLVALAAGPVHESLGKKPSMPPAALATG